MAQSSFFCTFIRQPPPIPYEYIIALFITVVIQFLNNGRVNLLSEINKEFP